MFNLNSLYLNLNKWDEGGVINNININTLKNIITINCEGPEYYIYKIYINIFDWLGNNNYIISVKNYNNIIIEPINN